jgi:hypothetical protein
MRTFEVGDGAALEPAFVNPQLSLEPPPHSRLCLLWPPLTYWRSPWQGSAFFVEWQWTTIGYEMQCGGLFMINIFEGQVGPGYLGHDHALFSRSAWGK